MTRTIWLCLRCGWRQLCSEHWSTARAGEHDAVCNGFGVSRYIDEHGRITGGARSRQP